MVTYAFITFYLFTAIILKSTWEFQFGPECSFELSRVSGGLPMSVLKAVLVTS